MTDPISNPLDGGAPEDFYNKEDSAYIRIQYLEDVDSFKFEVRNELQHKYQDIKDTPSSIASLSAFVRGMLEFALVYPNQMYRLGVKAQTSDTIMLNEEMSDDQKELLLGEPLGRA